MISYRAVVFDLDGTLVDSRADLATAVNLLRVEEGLPVVSVAAVGDWIGEGARRLVEKALAESGDEPPASALARFLGHYESVCTASTLPFPGMHEVVAELRSRLPVALLTNKPERMTRAIVDHCGWGGWFAPLVAGDSLPFRKPDGRTLLEVAGRLGLPAGDLLLVGDSRIDAATADAAGAGFLWAEWGYARREERHELALRPRAASPAELALRLSVV